MKKEYDFSKAKQGLLYRPKEQHQVPVYLDEQVREFYSKMAKNKKENFDHFVNRVLKKDMELADVLTK